MARTRRSLDEVGPGFRRAEWLAQRAISCVILGIPILALTGLLGGSGPLAATSASASGGEDVAWFRVARSGGRATLRVAPATGGRLAIEESYLAEFDVERVTPRPATETVEAGWRVYAFDAAPESVELELRPRGPGAPSGRVRTGAGELAVRTVVLP